jgi:hypothetical protein
MQLTLTDDDEIGVKQAKDQIFIRSIPSYHPEFCTEIVLRGNCLEAAANGGGHSLVGRFLPSERGSDCPLAEHIIIGSMLRETCGYDVNPGKVGTALVGERSCIVDPLFSFGGRVDEDPDVFQSHCISPISDV